MKRFQVAFCWSLAIMLGAVALPAAAAKPPQQGQDKSYGVEFLLPSVKLGPDGNPVLDSSGNPIANPTYNPGGVIGDRVVDPPVTIVVYIKNESPPSTAASNISSLTFELSPSLVLVNDPNVVSIGCPRAQCGISGNTIFVSNISPPIQGREVYPITLQVNTCVVANEAYIGNVNAYTGSTFGGSPFKLSSTDDTFTPALKLSTRGTDFPIDFKTQVTPTVTGISCGNIACLQPFAIGNDDPSLLPYRVVSGLRGLNADGTCSDTSHVGYFVTNKLGVTTDNDFPATSRSVHFVWPPDSTPVFAYKVTRNGAGSEWDLAWLPKLGLSPVALNADTLHCNGFITGDEPVATALPLPKAYGVLAQDVKVNTKQLKVDLVGTALPNIGDPVVVESERMVVTSIDSSGWSVTRTKPVFHVAGSTVASTPMPILGSVPAPYTAGDPAKMCLAWTNDTSAWVIDGSDGWVLGR
jgi:hypothetical protein